MEIDKTLESVEQFIKAVCERFREIDNRLDALEKRLSALENKPVAVFGDFISVNCDSFPNEMLDRLTADYETVEVDHD